MTEIFEKIQDALVGTAKQVTICGRVVKLGDYMEVEYTSGDKTRGGIIKGNVVELWNSNNLGLVLQARLSSGWCFHDYDHVLVHNQQRPVCPKCGNEIDPDLCWCGDSIKNHGSHDSHSPVPMGCDCGRVRIEDLPRLTDEPDQSQAGKAAQLAAQNRNA